MSGRRCYRDCTQSFGETCLVSSFTPLQQQVIALAGVVQATRMVDQVAKTGSYPAAFFEASLRSLFAFDAPTVDAVYGNIQGVKLGLRSVVDMLTDATNEDHVAMGAYVRGLLKLEDQFGKRPDLQEVVASRLGHVNFKAQHFSDDAVELAASISAIYQDTISHLPYRIKVKGNVQHLQQTKNADLVRTLLLAGLRSAHLWRQLGGRPRHFLFKGGKLAATASDLSKQLSPVTDNRSLH
ncbi:MAG TPA: lysogenization regulator HflD [Halieaceae bacterium]|nr:lysogenization regulator HflD [Halieaceae bacterium]